MYPDNLKALFEQKAREGDGSFAIAYALLELTDMQDKTAVAIYALGNANAATPMGAIEGLSREVGRVAAAIAELAEKSN